MSNGDKFSAVIERAKEAFGVKSDAALAEAIGLKATAFNNRKKTGSIPYDELIAAAQPRNVDITWLLTGIGVAAQAMVDSNDPLAMRKRKLKDMIDQADNPKTLDAVQNDLERDEQYRELKREMADLRRQVQGQQTQRVRHAA